MSETTIPRFAVENAASYIYDFVVFGSIGSKSPLKCRPAIGLWLWPHRISVCNTLETIKFISIHWKRNTKKWFEIKIRQKTEAACKWFVVPYLFDWKKEKNTREQKSATQKVWKAKYKMVDSSAETIPNCQMFFYFICAALSRKHHLKYNGCLYSKRFEIEKLYHTLLNHNAHVIMQIYYHLNEHQR